MKYSTILKELFTGISLHVEDLFVLESFQINYLPERVPVKEFAVMLHAYPYLRSFFLIKNPSIKDFITTTMEENHETDNPDEINTCCNELLWEIADLIVYNKYPELYDDNVTFNWNIDDIMQGNQVEGKIVADVGAGPGKLSFLLAPFTKTVYAIEPISRFREYIRTKVEKEKAGNIFALDGFLDRIPLPDNSLDMLFTSNAIGWNLENELHEIERVVQSGGQIIHLMRAVKSNNENPFHDRLISSDWNYTYQEFDNAIDKKIRYSKTV